ncbi:MaoC family dehydratase [Lentzea albidocapillata]|uniref:Acyl dehydratase n=1 Tax=Lentzea albidocapillata TaxID=40571 RepID=A0A1W2BF97_9PSEU|nr:MaoC/PaaZ C-terminal domain-containing protein [Lentzea albidocapillata]SMC71521.1 Acyl dehydratase [Lentzea albidocapillata]
MTARQIQVGTRLPEHRVVAVDAEHIRQVALILRDTNPIHFDVGAVSAAGLGDREINQGGTTMAYVLDLLTKWAGSREALRTISCSFRANVFRGDDVVVGGEVTAVTRRDDELLVECEVWADANGRRAIKGTATVVLANYA